MRDAQTLTAHVFGGYTGPYNQVVPAALERPGTWPEPHGGSDMLDVTYSEAVARIWKRVDRNGDPGSCWEWPGAHNRQGYGTVWVPDPQRSLGRQISVHRASLAEKVGRVLTRDEVTMHSCDNPPCVNPAHLSVGTPADNYHDMVRKGRGSPMSMALAAKPTKQTHCRRGHEFTPENTYMWRNQRHCRACGRLRAARYKSKINQRKGHPAR